MFTQRVLCVWILFLFVATPVRAYIDVTPTLGRLIRDASHIVVLRVEIVNLERRAIRFQKVADLKGQSSPEPVKHLITAGFHPREQATILEWAEPGQLAISFGNGNTAEVCIGTYWYECRAGQDGWWIMNCGQAQHTFAYSGFVRKLKDHVEAILAGKETTITAVKYTADDAYWRACKRVIAMRNLPHGNQFPVHRFKASLKMAGSIYGLARDPKFTSLPGAAGPEDVPALLADLDSPAWQVRLEAAQTLAAMGPAASDAVPRLRRALEDVKEMVRIHAAEALSAIDPTATDAVPVLAGLLKSTDARARKAAARALGTAGLDVERSVSALIETLSDADAKVRMAGADALGRFGRDAARAVPALMISLEDPDAMVRSSAADTLGAIGPRARQSAPALRALLDRSDKSLRPTVAAALYRIEPHNAQAVVPVLIEELQETDTRLRWHALNYLRKLAPEARATVPVPLLIVTLHDADFGVRGMSAWLLGEIGPRAEPAVPALVQALEANDVWVRSATAPALVKILGSRAKMAIPALIDGLADEDGREESLHALKRLGPVAAPALPTLRRLAQTESTLRGLVAETIWHVSHDAELAVNLLIEVVMRSSRQSRTEAIVALGTIGPGARSAVPTLARLLAEDDPEVREATLVALRQIDSARWATVTHNRHENGWGWRLAGWLLLLALAAACVTGWRLMAPKQRGA